ncbi:MAG: prolyl-tRNA synthetase associated domain-containing protein [Rhodothermia bacterium]|nr:MAG: prolyl-tRNA synthetase associated domain-containing protein [Rhodothermia bacterium]
MDIFAYLNELGIPFEKMDHPAVFTVEQAKQLVPPMRGANTKNLFVRNKRGNRHFLVIVGYGKRVDLKALSKMIEVSPLSLASPERLWTHLGVEPGSVSLLAITNDVEHVVDIVIDKSLLDAEYWKCHPHVNTSTLSIAVTDIIRIMEQSEHGYKVVEVPERDPST